MDGDKITSNLLGNGKYFWEKPEISKKRRKRHMEHHKYIGYKIYFILLDNSVHVFGQMPPMLPIGLLLASAEN